MLSVNNWNKLYENNRSRLVQDLKWVAVPNAHDGEAYSRMIKRPDAAVIFSAWILILQVASRCSPRGDLIKANKEAHDPSSLALRTRAPIRWFNKAIPVLIEMGWIHHKPLQSNETADRCAVPAPDLSIIPVNEGRKEEKEGREGKKDAASPTPLPFESALFRDAWNLFEQHRREIRKPLTPTATKLQLEQLAKIGEIRAIAAIRYTIQKGWQGIREPDGAPAGTHRPEKPKAAECPGWKAILNHEFPDSVFAEGQSRQADSWGDLSHEAQQLIWTHHHATK